MEEDDDKVNRPSPNIKATYSRRKLHLEKSSSGYQQNDGKSSSKLQFYVYYGGEWREPENDYGYEQKDYIEGMKRKTEIEKEMLTFKKLRGQVCYLIGKTDGFILQTIQENKIVDISNDETMKKYLEFGETEMENDLNFFCSLEKCTSNVRDKSNRQEVQVKHKKPLQVKATQEKKRPSDNTNQRKEQIKRQKKVKQVTDSEEESLDEESADEDSTDEEFYSIDELYEKAAAQKNTMTIKASLHLMLKMS